MATHLISYLPVAASWFADWGNMWGLLQAVLAVGFVIFVHELGHFLVARACGVKCEKFYVGFDVGGISLWKKKVGETVYGIGILPLGGYVKMLGQDDDPRKMAEENKRSKAGGQNPSLAETAASSAQGAPAASLSQNSSKAQSESITHDPRSYLAKSVPQRMAIISAGVIMNMIFAIIFASMAFGLGVMEIPCQVGLVTAGGGAWKSGITPGDQVLQIGEAPQQGQLRFSDLAESVVLSSQPSVKFVVKAPQGEPRTLMVSPAVITMGKSSRRYVGVTAEHTTRLSKNVSLPGTAARSLSQLAPGWAITAVNDRSVSTGYELTAEFVRHWNRDVSLTLQGPVEPGGSAPSQQVTLPPEPWQELGIEVEVGPITAIRSGSTAEKAGLKVGDKLVSVNASPLGDVLTLWQRLAKLPPAPLALEYERAGKRETVQLTLDEYPWPLPNLNGGQIGIPQLGVSVEITNRVAQVAEKSAAAEAGVLPGDLLISGKLTKAKGSDEVRDWEKPLLEEDTVQLNDGPVKWEQFVTMVQAPYFERTIELEVQTGQQKPRVLQIAPHLSTEYFNAERGLLFEPLLKMRKAQGLGEALQLGFRETISRAMHVVKVLQSLVSGRISANNMGGPLTIIATAAGSAKQGFTDLLMFLTFISANLAVLNILPIPVLDGGHLVFLAYEGIFRRPPNEKLQIALSLLGLAMLLSLMLFVTWNDISRFLLPG